MSISGSVDKQSVEVTSCYCVPHKDYEERVDVDVVYNQDMVELNKKVSPAENLVGWFTTGSEVTSHSSLIHDYYSRETKDPIHLTLLTQVQKLCSNQSKCIFIILNSSSLKHVTLSILFIEHTKGFLKLVVALHRYATHKKKVFAADFILAWPYYLFPIHSV